MIKEKPVLQAIKVLRSISQKRDEDSSKKKQLFEEKDNLYLQVTLKKLPQNKSIKMIKVRLPHPLLKDTSEVCLIVGDLDKKNHKAEIEPDVLHYKELLKKHGISNISEIFTLRQLRTEYKPYEAKQKLLAAYDVFLVDNRITECLPKILGRHFFKKRKFPLQINMKTSNLKKQIENALSTKVFYFTGHGNSCTSEIAYLDMSDSDIVNNVVAMAETLSDQLPGSWNNIMGVYLKTSLSKAIPLYMSYDDPNKVIIKDEEEDDSAEIDELSTMPHLKVKVYKDGRVKTISIREQLAANALAAEKNEFDGNVPETEECIKSTNELQEYEINDVSSVQGECKSVIETEHSKSTDEFQEYPINGVSSENGETFENGKKSKKKRKRENSMLTTAAGETIMLTPLQTAKKRKIDDDAKKNITQKKKLKGKKKKGNCL